MYIYIYTYLHAHINILMHKCVCNHPFEQMHENVSMYTHA